MAAHDSAQRIGTAGSTHYMIATAFTAIVSVTRIIAGSKKAYVIRMIISIILSHYIC